MVVPVVSTCASTTAVAVSCWVGGWFAIGWWRARASPARPRLLPWVAGWLAAPDVGPIYASPRRRWKIGRKVGLGLMHVNCTTSGLDPNSSPDCRERRRLRREAALKVLHAQILAPHNGE